MSEAPVRTSSPRVIDQRLAAGEPQGRPWSWRLGAVAGIDLYVHPTFLILLAWVAITSGLGRGDLDGALDGVGFILAVFGCVVLHELGHALTARRFGIRTRDITLLPIGGVARLERMPEDPRQELLVALAGPAVNFALASGLLALLAALHPLAQIGALRPGGAMFIARLLLVNVFLALFNLLPAFPMDGGRVLRALLAHRLGFARATQIAATTGQALALLFGAVGVFTSPVLVFIALFVWIGAAQEAGAAALREAIRGIPVGYAMFTEFATVRPDDTLGEVAELLLGGSQQDFPVLQGDRVVGVLPRSLLIGGLTRGGPTLPAREVMTRDFATVDAREMLEAALVHLESTPCPTMIVLRDDALVGLLNAEHVAEMLMVRTALRAPREGARPATSGPAESVRA